MLRTHYTTPCRRREACYACINWGYRRKGKRKNAQQTEETEKEPTHPPDTSCGDPKPQVSYKRTKQEPDKATNVRYLRSSLLSPQNCRNFLAAGPSSAGGPLSTSRPANVASTIRPNVNRGDFFCFRSSDPPPTPAGGAQRGSHPRGPGMPATTPKHTTAERRSTVRGGGCCNKLHVRSNQPTCIRAYVCKKDKRPAYVLSALQHHRRRQKQKHSTPSKAKDGCLILLYVS